MGLVAEIFMLAGGLYALATARVPSFLVGGGKYEVEGTPARIIGAVLMMPLPAAFLAESVLGYLLGEERARYAFWLEIALVVAACLTAVILMRVAGRPTEHASYAEALRANKAQGDSIFALLGRLGRGWLQRPARLVIALGIVLTGVGAVRGRVGLFAAGIVVAGLGVILMLARRAVDMWRGETVPQRERPTGWRRLGAVLRVLMILPVMGILGVAPVLFGLAVGLWDRSLMNAAGVVAGVSFVIVGLYMVVEERLQWARWLRELFDR